MNKKIKLLSLILLFLFVFPRVSLGCNFQSLKFGMGVSEILLPNAIQLDESVIHQDVSLASDEFCLDKPSIPGGIINLKFLYNRLVQLKIELNNSNLEIKDWAENRYGAIDPEIKALKNFQFLWEKENVNVVYSIETINDSRNEFLEISSNANYHLFIKYYNQLEANINENN
tara:strand:- start:527 stop:1042 length:516 start_codon:yes stop_codon:yes gene_type:complete